MAGLFGDVIDFFTGTSKTTQDQTSKVVASQDVEKVQIGGETTAATSQTGKTGATTQTGTTQLLSPEIQATLEGILQSFATPEATGARADIGTMLSERAATAPEDIQALIDPIVAEARTQGERKLGQAGQAISREAGSSLNSLVQLLQAEGGAELESRLGSLAGQLGLQGRQIATGEATSALTATGGEVSRIADILKGATQETTATGISEEQTTVNQLAQLTKVLEELTKGKTVSTTDATGAARQTGTILDFLKAIPSSS